MTVTTRAARSGGLGMRERLAAAAAALGLVACVLLVAAGAAKGGADVLSFSAYPSSTQAGGHPDVVVMWNTDTHVSPQLSDKTQGNSPRDIILDLPAGVGGNPHAYPKCDAANFVIDNCPTDAQVGVFRPGACNSSFGPSLPTITFCYPATAELSVPVFNLDPPPNKAGMTAFKTPIFNSPIFNAITARTGDDYGLRSETLGLQRALPVANYRLTLWGVPADPKNDGENSQLNYAENLEANGVEVGRFFPGPPNPFAARGISSNSPLKPFMSNATTCGETLESEIRVRAYDGEVTSMTAPWPATTGCGALTFNPSLAANPTTTDADTASGVDIALTVPQPQSPTTPSPSQIRAVVSEFPEGFSINPNAADGKTSCTDAMAKFGTEDEAECPEHAKIGALEVQSAVLPGDLLGGIYLGEPLPGDRYRLFFIFDGFGLHVKIPGTATLDKQTGQIKTSFQNLPQSPFEEFHVHFFGSERGVLATPEKCGTYPVRSRFTPWDSALPDQTSTQFFTIDRGPGGAPCPGATRPFSPEFEASSVGNTAGAYTPFEIYLGRDDGDQNLSAVDVVTPLGFSAKLAGVPYCPEPALAALAASNYGYSGLAEMMSPTCPAASQVGTVVAGAGAGSRPVHIPGKVYLSGPYKGAPLSLAVVIPAVSGPYDLGTALVRTAIHVDPVTARVTGISDPLPLIVEGVPVRQRSLRVSLDKPGFTRNPTNCSPFSTDATLHGDEGAAARLSSPYQAANCAVLPHRPKLNIKLSGGVKRRGHPAIRATFTAKPGEANSSMVSVLLPDGELLDNSHIGTICTRVQFAADDCPPDSIYGTAEATSPLLDDPVRGNVYLRSSTNKLPDLVVDLKGQIDIELSGRVDAVKGRLRTTFETIPDAPVSSFTLSMRGGPKGLVVNSENLCKEPKSATVRMIGQNGSVQRRMVKIGTSCGSTARHKRGHKRGHDSGKAGR